MLQLFYSPGAISLACHIALEECGAAFAIEKVSLLDGEQHQKAFRRLNPQGRVPVLMVHGEILTETLAILDYIDQAHPQANLMPRDIEQRAQVMAFLSWLATSVHVAFAGVWRPTRYSDDESAHASIKAFNRGQIEQYFAQIHSRLAQLDGEWLFGDYSLADINLLPYYRWGNRLQMPMRTLYPAWAAHTDRMLARAAVSTVFQREGIDLAESH